ncbi:MAG: hypothetical protein DWQ04_07060 [Chloroflexi bacterium]|nr:MAG: hypothetical protein DWQ04_07060 [Chloroflexota bacterium]
MTHQEHDPYQPHSHEPNPAPPSANPMFVVVLPGGEKRPFTPQTLNKLPQTTIADCYIVSTGHGTTGPFTFSGVSLKVFIESLGISSWRELEIVSADGFGNRVFVEELGDEGEKRPFLLATCINGTYMTRKQGLIRLIVPSETDDALRQVKWIGEVRVI